MISEFITQIKKEGLSKNNRFTVRFGIPKLLDVPPGTLRNATLFCDASALPGTNISTVQNRSYGEFREIPYERLYDTVTLSFYVDTGLKVKDLFDAWIECIVNPDTRTFNYYNDYITDMDIIVEDTMTRQNYMVTLYEVYPKTISPITLDWQNKEVMKLSVTMQYKYYRTTLLSTIPSEAGVSTTVPVTPVVPQVQLPKLPVGAGERIPVMPAPPRVSTFDPRTAANPSGIEGVDVATGP